MNGVVYSQLGGRLGNILFIIGAGISYAKKHNKEFRLLDEKFLHGYPILHAEYKRFISKVNSDPVEIYDDPFNNYKAIPYFENSVVLKGWFQSERHLDRSAVKNAFSMYGRVGRELLGKYPGIEDGVGIHVRRGDYIKYRHLYNVLNEHYYNNIYNSYFKGYACYVSSDDPKWCLENLKIPGMTIIDDMPEKSLVALSLCKNHILSCSTYSWWCAWINEQRDSLNVIPRYWFRKNAAYTASYIVPERWAGIDIDEDWIIK